MMRLYTADDNPGLKMYVSLTRGQPTTWHALLQLADLSVSAMPRSSARSDTRSNTRSAARSAASRRRDCRYDSSRRRNSDPVIVLSLAVVFVFSVVFLHLFTKFVRWFSK